MEQQQKCTVCQYHNSKSCFNGSSQKICSFSCLLTLEIDKIKKQVLKSSTFINDVQLKQLKKEMIKQLKNFEEDDTQYFDSDQNYDDSDIFISDSQSVIIDKKQFEIQNSKNDDEPNVYSDNQRLEINKAKFEYDELNPFYKENNITFNEKMNMISMIQEGVKWEASKARYVNIYSEQPLRNGCFYFQVQFCNFLEDLKHCDPIIGISLQKDVQGKSFCSCPTGWGLARGRLKHNQEIKFKRSDIYDTTMKPRCLSTMGVFVSTITGTIAFTKNQNLSEITIFKNVQEIKNKQFYPAISLAGDAIVQFQENEYIPENLHHFIDEGKVDQ